MLYLSSNIGEGRAKPPDCTLTWTIAPCALRLEHCSGNVLLAKIDLLFLSQGQFLFLRIPLKLVFVVDYSFLELFVSINSSL